MGTDKARNIAVTSAEAVCTADNSCLMHIGGTLSRQGWRAGRSSERPERP